MQWSNPLASLEEKRLRQKAASIVGVASKKDAQAIREQARKDLARPPQKPPVKPLPKGKSKP